jgi:hypothetical protein
MQVAAEAVHIIITLVSPAIPVAWEAEELVAAGVLIQVK